MIGKTNAISGGGITINGQTVDASVFLGSSVSAGDFVSQVTPPAQTVDATLYRYSDIVHVGNSQYLVTAGRTNVNNLYYYLVNLQNNAFSPVDSGNTSPAYSNSNILKYSDSELYIFMGKYSSSSPRGYLYKISISGNTASLTEVSTNSVPYSGYMLDGHSACFLEGGDMFCVNGYSSRTIVTKVNYSNYTLESVNLGNISFSQTCCAYAGNNKVIINSHSGMRVIDCNASTPTSSDTFAYNSAYSNASNIVSLGNNYFATVMRESSSSANAELNIVQLSGDTISFIKNISIHGAAPFSNTSYFELIRADDGTLYHAAYSSGSTSVYKIKLDNSLNLVSYDLVFNNALSISSPNRYTPNIKLSQINGAVGLGYLDDGDSYAKFWQLENVVAPYSGSVYGVAKSSGTSGQNIQVYIPNT